jgi:hypothetical protein
VTEAPGPAPGPARFEAGLLALVFVAALAWNLATGAIGLGHALSDSFGFRQTQTALSGWALLEGGPWLAYETPVLGPPWSVPMEFPLYQWLVALTVEATGLPLETAGRVVSRAFFYAALPMLWLLLAELRVGPAHRLVFLSLWLANPYFAFWSRTFLVETAAVFFGLAFLAFVARFGARGRRSDQWAAVIAGGLCAVVKSTTFPGYLGVAGLLLAAAWARRRRSSGAPTSGSARALVSQAVVLALPVAAGVAWSLYADSIKSRNPLAGPLGSGQVSSQWLFRPGADGWPEAGRRVRATVAEIAGGPLVLAAAALAAFVTRRRRTAVAVGLLAFAAVYVVFLRFHVVHLYYSCANGPFLIAVVGFGALALLETPGRASRLGWAFLALALGLGIRTYHAEFERVQRRNAYAGPNATVRLARIVAERTGPRDVIVGFGLDWSPEVPFYARRRSLMWPGHVSPDGAPLREALDRLEGERVGALLVCREGSLSAEALELLQRRLALSPVPSGRVGDCEVFSPLSPPAGGPADAARGPRSTSAGSAAARPRGGSGSFPPSGPARSRAPPRPDGPRSAPSPTARARGRTPPGSRSSSRRGSRCGRP